MTAIVLDGTSVAADVKADVTERAAKLAALGTVPGLGTILVGDDGPSAAYIGAKHKACQETGVASIHRHLHQDSSDEDVAAVIAEFNANPAVHAFIVQLPLPKGLDEGAAMTAVGPGKDADGLHPINLGRLVMGLPGPLPCTPAGIQRMLVAHDVPIAGRHVVVIGRGITIGRPLALLLALKRPHANAAVTVIHTGVSDLGAYTRQADILVAAAGSPHMVTPDMVKPGAAVVGAGITKDGPRLVSDVHPDVAEVAGWMTPRLGGVGPMTVAMLLLNTVIAAESTIR